MQGLILSILSRNPSADTLLILRPTLRAAHEMDLEVVTFAHEILHALNASLEEKRDEFYVHPRLKATYPGSELWNHMSAEYDFIVGETSLLMTGARGADSINEETIRSNWGLETLRSTPSHAA